MSTRAANSAGRETRPSRDRDRSIAEWATLIVSITIIAAKKKGHRKPAREKAEAPQATASNVINIMDALRKSVAAERKPKKT